MAENTKKPYYGILVYGVVIGFAVGVLVMYALLNVHTGHITGGTTDNLTGVNIIYYNNFTQHIYPGGSLTGFTMPIDSMHTYNFTIDYYNSTYNETIYSIGVVDSAFKIYGVKPSLPITISPRSKAALSLLLLSPNYSYDGPLNITVIYRKGLNSTG
jgi:hypothetical protein